ncbi:class I SAM-dependent methyltransferase [Corynebacterium sp. zg254]|uniref:Class I SAM-dependent methyltransferase n=1 Tax=Corynebacterium zhongnanshanii TaxID=2768834 RepID=A0ABQ6VEF3_9CORY|nr:MULTISPECIES: class I SAM-dependent methyltransferase [Corynebacterium]KAB3522703.1 class I SAM-dependent methyltransferase [Corynebacterium zhongnanshanii]MCR5914242.1 class I SAM-dependent methyltransferase [Corynebacterium sp. zg254]
MADHAHNLRARSWTSDGPIGIPTRGTTGFNRLRKSDRWIASHPLLRRQFQRAIIHEQRSPVAVDVGYGASHTTTCEWARFLRTVHPSQHHPVQVTGLEIEPSRVLPPRDGVTFALGGFELAGMRADLIRAFNVLRQYDVDQVYAAWDTMRSRLRPGGLIIEGTCDEIGRRSCWVLLDQDGPLTLTMAWDPFDVHTPSDIAERLPKALIHNNTPGHRIHDILTAMDDAWERAAPLAVFGPRTRWRQALDTFLSESGDEGGLRTLQARRRIQDNTITLPWNMVADRDSYGEH